MCSIMAIHSAKATTAGICIDSAKAIMAGNNLYIENTFSRSQDGWLERRKPQRLAQRRPHR